MTDTPATKGKHTTSMNGMTIHWHDDKMESVYANIGTATANREEFYLLLGTHQNWRGNAGDNKEIDVNLSTRVVLNPYAAKRFAAILTGSIKAYEDQFGKIDI
ncbi:DUF3467 domain-containing protein [Pseudomonas sp. GX19020]|uniref:DUF3467 domain-containing protein n=1 Tax=Pseudomonadota TaxID=1224 RepID=UPI0008985F12|nr:MULTISPECIES: DUF3467 domain-containing protein [Pseudomonadota]MCL4069187.1 DUF3467 domain-containing protein [Pseudomonas sp. GX19020]SED72655.1 Protein of unknown function [Rhodobacter sp. 24-YEA-8]